MKSPDIIELNFTSRCNLSCMYCFHHDGDAYTSDLEVKDWIPFLDDCKQSHIKEIIISGGEPFIRNDLLMLLRQIAMRKIHYSILSNGTLISSDIASSIFRIGYCDFIQVSIDGSCPCIHDEICGHGSFAKAIHGIQILQKYNIPVIARITISKKNMYDLEGIVSFLLDTLNVSYVSTNEVVQCGRSLLHKDDLVLSYTDQYEVMKTLQSLENRYAGRLGAQYGPHANLHTFKSMIQKTQPKGSLTGCQGLFNKLSVLSNGDIVPCEYLAPMKLGNIKQHKILDIWNHSPILYLFRERTSTKLKDIPSCISCEYNEYCDGGCPINPYYTLRSIHDPDMQGCLKRFIEANGELP